MYIVTTHSYLWGLIKFEHWKYATMQDVLRCEILEQKNPGTSGWHTKRKILVYSTGSDRVVRNQPQFRLDNHGCPEDLSIIEGVNTSRLYRNTYQGGLLQREVPQQKRPGI